MSVRILIGDCRERMKDLPDASVDSVVCDPPYHLTSIVKRFGAENAAVAKIGKTGAYARASKGFMGQTWDGGDVAFDPDTWAEVLRVLKPGGHLVAFSGTRTYHRMAVAIEDAGFEIRDQLAWVYGSGFPKSLDVSKAIDKAAGAEREVVGERKGGAALKINGDNPRPWHDRQAARGGTYDVTAPATEAAQQWQGWGTALKPSWEPICLARKPLIGSVANNVLTHGTGALNIDGCRIETDDNLVTHHEGGTGNRENWRTGNKPGVSYSTGSTNGRWPANLCHDGSDEVLAGFPSEAGASGQVQRQSPSTSNSRGAFAGMEGPQPFYADAGSAARFFYCAKATTEERGEGNNHPTVKPVALMRWLCRLVTPKGGTVLDPFMGSGSTGIAADAEQFNFIGCELSADYAEIARQRITAAAGMFADVSVERTGPSTQAA